MLSAQVKVRGTGPPEVAQIELISQEELDEISRTWVAEKHEFEDRCPISTRNAPGGLSMDLASTSICRWAPRRCGY